MDKCVLKIGDYYLASELDCEEARITNEIHDAPIFNFTLNIDEWKEEIRSMIEQGFRIEKLTETDVTNVIIRELNDASKIK